MAQAPSPTREISSPVRPSFVIFTTYIIRAKTITIRKELLESLAALAMQTKTHQHAPRARTP